MKKAVAALKAERSIDACPDQIVGHRLSMLKNWVETRKMNERGGQRKGSPDLYSS